MLAKNLNVSRGLVNGARGIIKGFESGSAGTSSVKNTTLDDPRCLYHSKCLEYVHIVVAWFSWNETVLEKMET